MNVKITQGLIDLVIFYWVAGYPREQIEHITKASHGTIHNIVTEALKSDPSIPFLREVAKAARTAGIQLGQLAVNIRLTRVIQNAGFPTDWFEYFLERLAKEYVMKNRPLEEIILKITEITEFMSSRNLTIQQAMASVGELKSSLIETEHQISESKRREKETHETVEQEMAKDRTTMADLHLLRQFEQQLASYGIPARQNLIAAVNALNKLHDYGYDPTKVGEKLAEGLSIEEQKLKLTAQCKELADTFARFHEIKANHEEFFRKQQAMLRDYADLISKYNLRPHEIAAVVKALRDHEPYVNPSELVDLISRYANIRAACLGMMGTYPFEEQQNSQGPLQPSYQSNASSPNVQRKTQI